MCEELPLLFDESALDESKVERANRRKTRKQYRDRIVCPYCQAHALETCTCCYLCGLTPCVCVSEEEPEPKPELDAFSMVWELSKLYCQPCEPRSEEHNGIHFFPVGHNASHWFYLGVDQDGIIWRRSFGESGMDDAGEMTYSEHISQVESMQALGYFGHH